MPDRELIQEKQVVIVGAGFGGLTAALELGRRGIAVTLVDRQNHHLFQPLLYQVATAALSPADIAAPIRTIVKHLPSVRVLMDQLVGVDPDHSRILLASGTTLPFDDLILATGARHSYFGNDGWAEHAPGIKTIDDAIRVRRDLLLALERAETMRQERPETRADPVTFAIVGGGPTGVEMAGAIAELARHAAELDFRLITKDCVKVVLIEGGPCLLGGFPEALSASARQALEGLGVEVRANARVTGVNAQGVLIDGELLPTAATIWAAGVQASPVSTWLGRPADRAGRVTVGGDLSIADRPNVFVIGDAAAVVDPTGGFVPGIAPAAKQQGEYVARTIARRHRGSSAQAPFRYRNRGKLATIGRKRAVVDFGWARVTGLPAWLLWGTAHIYFLVGFRNRVVVGANWLWHYVTFDRGARLITGRMM